MRCPKCGGEMEKGYLESHRRDIGLTWYPESRKRPFNYVFTESYVERKGGVILNDPGFGFGQMTVPAWLCRGCRVGLFTWDEEGEGGDRT